MKRYFVFICLVCALGNMTHASSVQGHDDTYITAIMMSDLRKRFEEAEQDMRELLVAHQGRGNSKMKQLRQLIQEKAKLDSINKLIDEMCGYNANKKKGLKSVPTLHGIGVIDGAELLGDLFDAWEAGEQHKYNMRLQRWEGKLALFLRHRSAIPHQKVAPLDSLE